MLLPSQNRWVQGVVVVYEGEGMMSNKILVVDDEPNLLRVISYALESEGYTVITAENGVDALEKVTQEQPSLVILDVKLPLLSGVEVCRQLRSNPDMQGLPIIMLSARIQVTDKITGLKAGADEYITKPVDTDELVARVTALLERTRRLQETQVPKKGTVLTFVGARGGAGTTTVALNFAAALVAQKKTVVIVELTSAYGTLALQLQQEPTVDLGNVLALEPAQMTAEEIEPYMLHLPFSLQALCAPQRFDEAPKIPAAQAERLVATLATMADCVIVDLSDFPSHASQSIISQSAFTFLVVEPEPIAVHLGKAKLERLACWTNGHEAMGAIVNRRAMDSSMTLQEVERQLACRMMGVIPPATEALETAQQQGLPLVVAQPDHLVSTNICDMVNRLAGIRFRI